MMKEKNNLKVYLLSFFIPLIIFFITSTLAGYIPIFKEVFQVYDARHQYPGLYMELINRINAGNIFYSFNGGLGFNFIGTLTYYLMSPLNILLFFFKNYSITYFFMLIIYLRVGLSGLTMSIYLSSQENNNKKWTIIFSTIFALSGFLVNYYYNFMWIDSIIMLPLIMLGIDKMFKNGSYLHYIICLTLGIFFNYYIGVILCIFCVIYFIYKLCATENYDKKKVIKTFIFSSLACGLLSTIILIPTIFALLAGKATMYGSDFINYSGTTVNLKQFFYNLTPGAFKANDQSYGPAMVYSSLFAVVQVILFFYNTKFKKKEKACVFLILLFYYLCFSFNLLDFAWQLFQRPVWWQSRYSFTFITFVIYIAYRNFTNLNTIKITNSKKVFITIIWLFITMISAIATFNSSTEINKYFYLGFSLLYFLQVMFLIQEKNIDWYLILLIILELSVNAHNSFRITYYNNDYYTLKWKVLLNETATSYINEHDKGFYRTELLSMNTNNDGMLHNYKGINFFNSSRNQNTMDFLEKKLGITVDSGCGVKLNNFNPALMSLLNVKYMIGKIDYYDLYYDNKDKSVYQNKYPLSIGFMISDEYKNITLTDDNKNYNLTSIYKAFADDENLSLFGSIDFNKFVKKLDRITYEDEIYTNVAKEDDYEHGKILFEFTSNKNVLILCGNGVLGDIKLNGKEYTVKDGGWIYLKKGDKLTAHYSVYDFITDSKLVFKTFEIDKYEEACRYISNNLLNVDNKSNHLLSGKVNVTKDKTTLFTTIPYEKGFTIKVDGKEVKPIKIFDTFIGLELTEGEHDITIDYVSYGFKTGAIISTSTLLILIVYTLIRKERKNK